MERSEFLGHALWASLDSVASLLTEIDGLGDTAVSSGLEDVRRARAFTVSLRELDQLYLVGHSYLNELNQAWDQVRVSLQNYLQNPAGHVSHLENAKASYFDAVQNALSRAPRPEENAAKKAASTRAATAYIEQVENARQVLSVELHRLEVAAHETQVKHAKEVEELRQTLQELTTQIDSSTTRISEGETRLTSALNESNEAFLKAQGERHDRFRLWLEEQEERFSEDTRPQHESIMAAAIQAEEALAEVTSLRTSVVQMSSLATGDILGDEYKKSSDKDRIAGYVGYVVGGTAGVVGVLILLFAFGSPAAGISWPQVALKLGLTTGIAGVATMAFRFGGQAMSRATAFKRQELELRALTPFLHEVVGSDEVKLNFVRQAFGRAWLPDSNIDNSADASSFSELLKVVQSAMEIAAKNSK